MRCKWGKIHAPSYSVRALSVPRKGGSNHWRFGWLATPEKKTQTLIRSGFWMLELCVFLVVHQPKPIHLILASWEGKSRIRRQTLKNFPKKILPPKFQKKTSFWKGIRKGSSNDIPILGRTPTWCKVVCLILITFSLLLLLMVQNSQTTTSGWC